MNRKAVFVSDLHLFCERSYGESLTNEIHHAAGSADVFVLGGDIFDFRWSSLGNVNTTIQAARSWIEKLVRSNPNCQFHYLLGNHDCAPEFVEQVHGIASSGARLEVHPWYLQIDDVLFLHGDVSGKLTTHDELQRARGEWELEEPRGKLANMAYNAAVAMRLHRAATRLAHPTHKVAQRLLYYMSDVGLDSDAINRVYFGHTHLYVEEFQHSGIRFFNGGAPIRGLRFEILNLNISHQMIGQ